MQPASLSVPMALEQFLMATDVVGRVVLALLLLMSLVTWTVILMRAATAPLQSCRSRRFLTQFRDSPTLDAAATVVRDSGEGDAFANVARHGLTAIRILRSGSGDPALAHRPETALVTPEAYLAQMLKRGIDQGSRAAEFGLGALASIASAAPFVGLLGTVWGVYQALVAIGQSGQGTLDKVAGPIGEALIMTGLGLVVAIPAVLAYNFFARRTRYLAADLEWFASEVVALFASGTVTTPWPQWPHGGR